MKQKTTEKTVQRLLDMIDRFNAGECLSLEDLTLIYNVSERTIFRDLQRLQDLKKPLCKNDHGYSFIKQSSNKRQFHFDELKKFAELSGVQHIYPTFDAQFVRHFIHNGKEHTLQVKKHIHENVKDYRDNMRTIQTAIEQKRLIIFDYKDKIRNVEPYRLIHQDGVWYLAGVDQQRLKTYRLSQITNLYLLSTHFEQNSTIIEQIQQEQHIWFSPNHEKQYVVVCVSNPVIDYFQQRALLPMQQILKQDHDGNLFLSCSVSHKRQLFQIIRAWIPHLRIIEPHTWQNELEAELKAYLFSTQPSEHIQSDS